MRVQEYPRPTFEERAVADKTLAMEGQYGRNLTDKKALEAVDVKRREAVFESEQRKEFFIQTGASLEDRLISDQKIVASGAVVLGIGLVRRLLLVNRV